MGHCKSTDGGNVCGEELAGSAGIQGQARRANVQPFIHRFDRSQKRLKQLRVIRTAEGQTLANDAAVAQALLRLGSQRRGTSRHRLMRTVIHSDNNGRFRTENFLHDAAASGHSQ